MEFNYKKANPDVNKRRELSNELISKEPNKVPVILEKDPRCKIQQVKTKHLLLKNCTVNTFLLAIKNKLKLPENEALFLSAKGKYNIMGEQSMGEIYSKYKDKEDGFLYIIYSSELIYG